VASLETTRLVLHDGTAVFIDAKSIARNDSSIMILGTPAARVPVGVAPVARDTGRPPLIGVIVNPAGEVAEVTSPISTSSVLYPRAASAGARGWHVVFASGAGNWQARGDSGLVTLWYGRFDGGAWRHLSRLGEFPAAVFVDRQSSEIVVLGDDVHVAFPVGRLFGNAIPGTRGIVMLHGHEDLWHADTLQTWARPSHVQLVANRERTGVVALATQTYYAEKRIHASALFTATFDSAWHQLSLVQSGPLGSNGTPVALSSPHAVRVGPNLVAAWAAGAKADSLMFVMNLDAPGSKARVVSTFPAWGGAPMVPLDPNHVLWMVRAEDSTRNLRLLIGTESTVVDAGSISVPLDNLVSPVIQASDGSVILVTGGLGQSPHEPAAATYISRFSVRCAL
jgi:hypothetical protein